MAVHHPREQPQTPEVITRGVQSEGSTDGDHDPTVHGNVSRSAEPAAGVKDHRLTQDEAGRRRTAAISPGHALPRLAVWHLLRHETRRRSALQSQSDTCAPARI